MRYSRQPGPALATILIISAIDVLLCSFTAGLTLFIFTPSPSTHASARASAVGDLGGGAADNVRVVISNEADNNLQFTGGVDVPKTNTAAGSISVLRLKGLPSPENPVWIGTTAPCKGLCAIQVAATIYVIRSGRQSQAIKLRLACVADHQDVAALVNADDPIVDLCGQSQEEPTSMRAGLIQVLRDVRAGREKER